MSTIRHIALMTKEDCSYCTKAIDLLRQEEIPYLAVEAPESNFLPIDFIEAVKDMKTFPKIAAVTSDGTYIPVGGFNELGEFLMDNMDAFPGRSSGSSSIFEGEADAREVEEVSGGDALFRKRYRKLSDAELNLHDRIKDQAVKMADLFYEVAPIHKGPVADREKGASVQLAIRHLEDAVYRAVKALTA